MGFGKCLSADPRNCEKSRGWQHTETFIVRASVRTSSVARVPFCTLDPTRALQLQCRRSHGSVTGSQILPDPLSNLSRRWTVIASGLLLSALALVMLYTGRAAFHSPLAIVVIAAIGLAAALLQLRLRGAGTQTMGAPVWLNVLGLLCALTALFSDMLHLGPTMTLVAALAAVICFAISSFLLFDHLRKKRF